MDEEKDSNINDRYWDRVLDLYNNSSKNIYEEIDNDVGKVSKDNFKKLLNYNDFVN